VEGSVADMAAGVLGVGGACRLHDSGSFCGSKKGVVEGAVARCLQQERVASGWLNSRFCDRVIRGDKGLVYVSICIYPRGETISPALRVRTKDNLRHSISLTFKRT
jgi:hypothetical protein